MVKFGLKMMKVGLFMLRLLSVAYILKSAPHTLRKVWRYSLQQRQPKIAVPLEVVELCIWVQLLLAVAHDVIGNSSAAMLKAGRNERC